jgi:D-2-hydroxyacid dehydrogenase (NADP+)
MIRKIKSFFLRSLVNWNKRKWKNPYSIKILIQTNQWFNEFEWNCIFQQSEISLNEKLEVEYSRNKIDSIKLFREADIIFCFGLSQYIEFNANKPVMIYLSTVGTESVNWKVVPASVKLTTPKGISSEAIAEYSLSMAIILSRKLDKAFRNQFNRIWDQERILDSIYKPLHQHTIGIVGLGNVGKAISDKFKRIGCKVFGCDSLVDDALNLDKWYFPDQLNEMLHDADIIVLCLPLTDQTKGLIGSRELESIGKKGYLINVSRGEIVDEKALITALRKKIIAGAATDVCRNEPLPHASKFWETQNLIITPHIAGNINLFSKEIMNDFINKTLTFIGKNV